MDPGIHFGDFAQASPTVRVRPDGNGQLAVVTVGQRASDDLPIFVDFDAMRDMITHAHSDRHVELGGVLLGGQYQDQHGLPFVLVSDCLRAQHFESTKGSFKFTHATWEQITRDRELLPAELAMVGWYHTHPGWGVFLSGLDKFICENFFNKPLDVALVIDPCHCDTGIFQWTGNSLEPIRRTGGFSLFASRFRRDELLQLATELESQVMPESVRPAATPVTIPLPPRSPIPLGHPLAVWGMFWGMLGTQFLLTSLLVIRLFFPAASITKPGDASDVSAGAAASREALLQLDQLRAREADVQAKFEVLEFILRQQGPTPDRVLTALADRTGEVEQLRYSLRAQQSLARELDTKIVSLESSLRESRQRDEQQQAEISRFHDDVSKLEAELRLLRRQLADSRSSATGPLPLKDGTGRSTWLSDWKSLGFGTVLAAVVVGLAWFVWRRRRGAGDDALRVPS